MNIDLKVADDPQVDVAFPWLDEFEVRCIIYGLCMVGISGMLMLLTGELEVPSWASIGWMVLGITLGVIYTIGMLRQELTKEVHDG